MHQKPERLRHPTTRSKQPSRIPTGIATLVVTSKLDHPEWESLDAWRAKTQLTMLFKIIHGLVDILAEDYIVPASTRTCSQH